MLDGRSPTSIINNGHNEIPYIEPSWPSSSSTSAKSTGFEAPASSSANDTRFRRMSILSPRSSNYERLEGGMGPSRSGGKKFGWKKFAVGAVAIVGLVWFFGPREPRSFSWGSKKNEAVYTYPSDGEASTRPPSSSQTTHPYHQPEQPPNSPVDAPVDHALDEVVSFETDPDPSSTTHCSTPYQGGGASQRLVQYALMIDAGSTGSRIHVYKFNNCGPSPEYEYETFKMTQPGLSSYADRPDEAARSLDVLLDEAMRVVPESLRKCTPVAVKATAGLRFLPGSQSGNILDAVKKRLHEAYPFPLKDEGGVVIMDGKDEGVYAWITANYLLNTIRPDTPRDIPTYAVLDLGGASTQIVFEPIFSKPDSSLAEGEHKYDLKFGGKTHVLYQHSYLGYGLMRARQHVHRLVDFMESLRPQAANGGNTIVGNACLAKGTRRVVEIEDEKSGEKKNVTMDGEEIGGFEACNRIVQLVMAKDAICELKPCSFDGVYQPSLLDTFPSGKILLLSYFYDRLHPLLRKDSQSPITVSTLASTAQDICLGRPRWLELWGTDPELMKELEERPEWCLDLTFMHALLRLGYEFGGTREVTIGKKIGGTELGWCLGATIAMVGGELTCRI